MIQIYTYEFFCIHVHEYMYEYKWILFNGWVIFHSVYVPQLPYPFVCWWASRLLPCPSYYKQRFDEHWGACVCFSSGFLGVYAWKWNTQQELKIQSNIMHETVDLGQIPEKVDLRITNSTELTTEM